MRKKEEKLVNHLHENHYTMPTIAISTLTRQELRSTLLATDGMVLACGRSWDIKSKHLGAGVYQIKLQLHSQTEK